MDLQKYLTYNSSFKDGYIYRLGSEAGFFSEYNNMILAMLWCLENKKQFILQSQNANFSVTRSGWQEYFKPFMDEIINPDLDQYNNRYSQFTIGGTEFPLHCMSELFNASRGFYAGFNDNIDSHIIDIPEVELKGTIQHCCGELHKMIWHYNDFVGIISYVYSTQLHLPKEYVSCHIRLGDKIVESDIYDPKLYIEKLKEYTDIKDVFILTDDYRAIEDLSKMYPEYHFFTLCQPNERGYSITKLDAMSPLEKQLSLIRLFTSIDIIRQSKEFVGTFSANPGMAVGFTMENEHMHCLDFDHWRIW